MFIAALFIITEIRKQSNCPSTDEQIMKMNIYTYIYNGILLSNEKYTICGNMDRAGDYHAK